MSQNDMVIANANGATVRADINSALQALASSNGGATAPSTTYANQFWFDTTADILKIRDEANANWVNMASLVGTTWVPYSNGSVLGTLANLNASSVSAALAMASNTGLAMALTSVSSGTPNFASSGNTVSLSGTATANTLGTVQAGFIGVIHYGIAVTVTHNATSRILPGGVSVNWAIGDVEIVVSLGSGNWRTIGYSLASGRALQTGQIAAKTASYNVTDSDNGGFLRFSGLSTDVNVNLPTASGRAGFTLTVINEDTTDTVPNGVVIDPFNTELIDGLASRKGHMGTRVMIVCDGTGWRTVHGYWRYFSGNQSLTANTTLALTHTLGVQPRRVWGELKCTTADLNYSVGDIITTLMWSDSQATNNGITVQFDGTTANVNVVTGGALIFFNKTTRVLANPTLTSWRFRLYMED